MHSTTEKNKTQFTQNIRPSMPAGRDKNDSYVRSLKSQLISFKDSLTNNINEHSPERVLQDISGAQTVRPQQRTHFVAEHRHNTEQNHIRSISAHSNGLHGLRHTDSAHASNMGANTSSNIPQNRQSSALSSSAFSPSRPIQFKSNMTNSPGISNQIYQSGSIKITNIDMLEQRLKRTEQQLKQEHDKYLKKCLQAQKSNSQVYQAKNQKQMLERDIENLKRQIESIKKNSSNISKLLNDARLRVINLQGEKKNLICALDDEKLKCHNLEEQKKALELQIKNFQKVKEFMLKFEQTDQDHKQQIKNNIAYELRMIEQQHQIQKELELGKGNLKQAQQIHNSITADLTQFQKQINNKVKELISQKTLLQKQLDQAKAEIETIRKNLFSQYQNKIDQLQNQIIVLKEENVVLKENSDSKIQIIRLQREIGMLQTQNKDLLNRNKEMVDKYVNEGNAVSMKRNISEISSESSSMKNIEYYDRNGQTDLSLIIMNYETRSTDLNSRINQKQANEQILKKRLQQLQQENQQLKDSINLKKRKQRSITQSSKNQVEAMKLQLKNQKQSIQCKIEMLEANVKRKNKEIKEKDQFITKYLITKVKGERDAQAILEQVQEYFKEKEQQVAA